MLNNLNGRSSEADSIKFSKWNLIGSVSHIGSSNFVEIPSRGRFDLFREQMGTVAG